MDADSWRVFDYTELDAALAYALDRKAKMAG
jgi:hypothetical protein